MPPKFSEQIDVPYIDSNAGNCQHRTSPCEYACPAGNPIQKIHTLIANGKEREAGIFLLARNPMSAITARVCPHPCELECNRKELDEAVSIQDIEYHVSNILGRDDMDFPRPCEQTGKRVAVVGAGPAGLTCAYFLSLFGHQVTILEAENVAGGVPGLVIPKQKLPEDIVSQAVRNVLKTGISIKTNTRVGRDISIEELHKNYDAMVITAGAWEERTLGVEGEDACIHALYFLRMARSGDLKNVADHVVIIGGGGVAFDCAMVAKQNGASHVRILCLEKEDSLCAYPDDVAAAKEAGIDITGSCRIESIELEKGKVKGVSTRRIRSFRFDETGHLLVEKERGPLEKIKADSIIIAVGQRPSIESFMDKERLKINSNGTICLDEKTGMTSMDG
ncbi:MAG: FAD-dependent oxidoreductase, partial [Deltaproteobacteria bacterium]|nr:FAD-dependent oxidoreductase [Deltaproteobacteria bacterium]